MQQIDFARYKFNCLRCGKCCSNVVKKQKINAYGYDCFGKLSYNPKISMDIPYFEIPKLKVHLLSLEKENPIVHPLDVFFLKEKSVGFIFGYQLAVKNDKMCYFYDSANKRCEIYQDRPNSCRYYPLSYNPENLSKPIPHGICQAFMDEIARKCPSIQEGTSLRFSNFDIAESFKNEFKIYLDIIYYLLAQRSLFFKYFKSSILNIKNVKPTKVNHYKLLDFSEFFSWASKHLYGNTDQIKLRMLMMELEELKKHFKTSYTSKTELL